MGDMGAYLELLFIPDEWEIIKEEEGKVYFIKDRILYEIDMNK